MTWAMLMIFTPFAVESYDRNTQPLRLLDAQKAKSKRTLTPTWTSSARCTGS